MKNQLSWEAPVIASCPQACFLTHTEILLISHPAAAAAPINNRSNPHINTRQPLRHRISHVSVSLRPIPSLEAGTLAAAHHSSTVGSIYSRIVAAPRCPHARVPRYAHP